MSDCPKVVAWTFDQECVCVDLQCLSHSQQWKCKHDYLPVFSCTLFAVPADCIADTPR